MLYVAIVLAVAVSTDALSVANRRSAAGKAAVKALQCNDAAIANLTWGIFIDGRDGTKGPMAYGNDYYKHVGRAIAKVHDMAKYSGEVLRLSDWKNITKERFLRSYRNPVSNEVRTCQTRVFDHGRIAEIFKGITVMDRSYEDTLTSKSERSYDKVIGKLIQEYNEKMGGVTTTDNKLRAIAFLMRNLAYLHPLADSNGRSRVLLTQYELRRNGIACGTMMYNNNKDIYFQTEKEFAEKLKEGIEMYDKAVETKQNPWSEASAKSMHRARFPNAEADELKSCWHNFCNKDWNDHHVSGHKACTGTTIALKEQMPGALKFAHLVDED